MHVYLSSHRQDYPNSLTISLELKGKTGESDTNTYYRLPSLILMFCQRVQRENDYSPLFSPISTHSAHNVSPHGLAFFNPKRTMSSSYFNRSRLPDAHESNLRAISLAGHCLPPSKVGDTNTRGRFLKEITSTLVDTGKFFWNKLLKKGEYHNSGENVLSTNKRKIMSLSDCYLIPRKRRRILKANEILPRNEESKFPPTEGVYDNDTHGDTLRLSKDPFNWNDWRTDVIKPKDEANPMTSYVGSRYGTSFRRARLSRQAYDRKDIKETQWNELKYLRKVFNGEYKVPKIIQDERENQIKILQSDKNATTKTRNYIVDLTEKIKNIILEKSNEETKGKDEDLVILKEQRVDQLETKRREYRCRLQRYNQSKTALQGEFKMYKNLLNERKRMQDEVRKKKNTFKGKSLVPVLDKGDLIEVEKNLRRQDNIVLTNRDNIEVSTRDFRTLSPGRWLNDTVIEFFMHYIERQTPKTVAFNSYFYTNLSERGYQGVRRWMRRKKVKIEELEKIFVPINLNQSHWALGMVDVPSNSIYYVDSLSNGPNALGFSILSDLQNYIIEESNNTMGADFTLKNLSCPQQPNGFDCGIYLCLNTLYLSNGSPMTFDHKDAVRMRQYIAHLILLQGSK